jgi:all-trans-retinol 13,14-reductase
MNVYSSTPLTYKDYIGTPEGSLYGIMKDYNNPIATTINTKTRISNLYLTGQNIIFHGILGATIGAFVTCFNFIDPEETIKKIKEYEK